MQCKKRNHYPRFAGSRSFERKKLFLPRTLVPAATTITIFSSSKKKKEQTRREHEALHRGEGKRSGLFSSLPFFFLCPKREKVRMVRNNGTASSSENCRVDV